MNRLMITRTRGLALTLAALFVTSASAQEDAAPESPLVKLLKSGKVPPARLGAIVEQVAGRGSAADLGYLFGRAIEPNGFPEAIRVRTLEALAEAANNRKVRPVGDLAGLVPLIAEPAARLAAIRLAGIWRVEATSPTLREVAVAADSSEPARAAAMEALAAIGGEANKASLVALAGPPNPVAARMQAIAALARLDLSGASRRAASLLREAEPGRDLAPMLAPILSVRGGPEALEAALAEGDLSPGSARLALRAVYALGRADAGLVAALNRAAGIEGAGKPLDRAGVERLVAEVATKGDAARGERVFRRADLNCMKCHAVAGAAGGVGPELSSVGASSPVDYLVNSILLPDQAIKEEFVTKVVQTADGRVYHGIVVDRDDRRLVLREATGETRAIPADEIDDIKDGGSLMPKGLVDGLPRADFVDLLRFLSELGKPGPYALHATPTIQRWRLRKGETWAPAYAMATGVVPLADLAAEVKEPVVTIRGEVRITDAGPVEFRLGSAGGVEAAIDGKGYESGATLAADLAPGIHTLTLKVDPVARGDAPLKVEVVKPAGSSAEFTVVGGQ